MGKKEQIIQAGTKRNIDPWLCRHIKEPPIWVSVVLSALDLGAEIGNK